MMEHGPAKFGFLGLGILGRILFIHFAGPFRVIFEMISGNASDVQDYVRMKFVIPALEPPKKTETSTTHPEDPEKNV